MQNHANCVRSNIQLPPTLPLTLPPPRRRIVARSSTSSDPKARIFLTSSPAPFSLRLSFSRPLSLLPISPLFLAYSPSSPSRSSALRSSAVPQHPPAATRFSLFIPPDPSCRSRARESERQKCFDDCVPRRLFLYFCRGGGIPGWAGQLPPPLPPPPAPRTEG